LNLPIILLRSDWRLAG